MTEENQYLVTGVVANGFDIDQREKLSKDFDKIKVNSNSIIVSGARIPFTMIKPIHVVEIESTDIINSTSEGFIKRELISFNGEYNDHPLYLLLFPPLLLVMNLLNQHFLLNEQIHCYIAYGSA